MARRRKNKGRKTSSLDPEDVLAGHAEVRPEELFDLIHRVNPTGRAFPRQEQDRRYRLKQRLQSLLVRRFGDEYLVVRPEDDDGVVSLGHRSGTRDACHARVEDLEPDARSWVRRRLDLDALPADADGVPASTAGAAAEADDGTSVTDLVGRARQALREYDYEAAERDLTAAFDASAGSLDAALPLVELWVESLGLYQQALELEPRLHAEARSQPAVRTYLALAAARCGERERAVELVRGIDAQGAAEVFVVLAAAAVRDRDLEPARSFLEQARRRDPAHPELPRLDDATADLEASRHRPVEEALLARFEQLGAQAVEAEARLLLGRWPASETAGRILRQAAGERRRAEIDEHLEIGEQAAAEARFGDAVLHFQRALDLGSDQPGLADQIDAVRRRERKREEDRRLDAAVARLERSVATPAGEDPAAALLAYLALPEALRERLRRRFDSRVLAWLEQVSPPSSGTRAQAAVAAVLALERARAALAEDPAWSSSTEAACAELEAHQVLLRGVPEARAALTDARSRATSARRESAREILEAALRAFADDEAGARKLLDAVDLGDLDESDLARARDLRRCIRQAEEREMRLAELERRRAAGDFTAALGSAVQLGQLAESDADRHRWTVFQDELRRQIRESWHVEVVEEPSGASATPLSRLQDVTAMNFSECFRVWLDDTGSEAVLPSTWDSWLFLRHVDVRRSRWIASVSLRTPRPLGELMVSFVDGDRLWLVGKKGDIVELAYGTWDVLGWRSLEELLPHGAKLSQAAMLPGAGYLWLQADWAENRSATYVVDLGAWHLARTIPSQPYIKPILGPAEIRVVGSDGKRLQGGGSLYTPRGVQVEQGDLKTSGRLSSVAAAPDGEGMVAVLNQLGLDGWAAPGADLVHFEPAASGGFEVTARQELPDPNPLIWQPVMTSLETGLVYVRTLTRGPESPLVVYERTASGFVERYRVAMPLDAVLVQDRGARHVAVLYAGDRSVEVLASPPPVTVSGRRHRESRIPVIEERYVCAPMARVSSMQDLWENTSAMRTLRGEARGVHLRKLRASHSQEQVAQILANALALPHFKTDVAEYRRYLESLPEHASALLYAATLEERHNAPEETRALLRDVDPDGLRDLDARHFYHLLGLDEMRQGQRESAIAKFRQGAERPLGNCSLEALVNLLTPMSEPPEPADWDVDRPVPRQVLGAIRAADLALAAGNVAAARAVLERPAFWLARSLQAAARLAAAWLELETPSRAERLAKRLALACFVHLHDPPYPPDREETQLLDEAWCQEGFFADFVWDPDRIDEVASRALAWLGDEY